MVAFILTVLAVFGLLCVSELLWRKRGTHPEYTRKFVHVSVGSFAAFWPFFLTRWQILVLSGAFVVVVAISSHFNIFSAIHSTQRPTWGELLFALAVGTLAYVAHNPWIFAASLLNMSVADGLAAIFGVKFGQENRYRVFGHTKSVVGTMSFFVVSMTILATYSFLTTHDFNPWLIVLASGATLLENIGIRGVDNLLVPLVVAVALNMLR